MSDNPEALLPCPFCGGKAEFERTGTGRQSCIVACGNCGARHESSDEYEQSGASWNTRAALAQQAATPTDPDEMAAAEQAHMDVCNALAKALGVKSWKPHEGEWDDAPGGNVLAILEAAGLYDAETGKVAARQAATPAPAEPVAFVDPEHLDVLRRDGRVSAILRTKHYSFRDDAPLYAAASATPAAPPAAQAEPLRWLVGTAGQPLKEHATWTREPDEINLDVIAPALNGQRPVVTPLYAAPAPAAQAGDAREDELHFAVCQAVAASNDVELVRTEAGRKVRDILRQALVAYADAARASLKGQPEGQAAQAGERYCDLGQDKCECRNDPLKPLVRLACPHWRQA